MTDDSPIIQIKGIGPKSAEHFHKAGIETVGDLIRYFPREYDVFEDPVPIGTLSASDDGKVTAVEGQIQRQLSVRFLRSVRIVTGKIVSGGAVIDVTWYNMPFMRSQVLPGVTYIFRGSVRAKGDKIFLQQPKVYDVFDYTLLKKTLQPVYPLVRGLTENSLRRALKEVLCGTGCVDLSEDFIPADIVKEYGLMTQEEAVREVHFPKNKDVLSQARRRLAFDEFLLFILMLKQLRESRNTREHGYAVDKTEQTKALLDSLPYHLTGAQERVWNQISNDLASKKVMARLIQGDVGSGKTIVAFLALVQTAANGMQGALMVPTEVLARQHYEAFNLLCEKAGLDCRAVLLTGSMKTAERRKACAAIESGQTLVVIGTHALIQEKVNYKNLALVITDEQHRFGVHQRETLALKGQRPHTIVMSATPIPRTLAVILYGDLDVSMIDELPSDRLPVRNAVVGTGWRPKAYRFIASQAEAGHQAYVICPMVEESEEIEAENVIDYTDTLRQALTQILPDLTVEYLHGKMKNAEKNEIMARFSSGEIDVLVSTTVVEVGVNVPNATVMMVENAERFGLAQLHQLRGRVGRGKDQSYCIFMHTADNETIRRRLEILENSNDGFEIAQKDLELRGPGELFGVRQSGELSFKIADIYADASVMKQAAAAAEEILSKSPSLTDNQYSLLREKLIQAQGRENELVSL